MHDPATAVVSLLKQSGSDIESQISGTSMAPALPPGARIRIRCGHHPSPGDTVVYLTGQPIIAHRMLSRVRRGGRAFLMLRGDANWFCDAPIDQTRVLGIVSGFDDGAGWRPVPARERDRLAVRVLVGASYWAVLTGLMLFGERVAYKVSQILPLAAAWLRRTGPRPGAPLAT